MLTRIPYSRPIMVLSDSDTVAKIALFPFCGVDRTRIYGPANFYGIVREVSIAEPICHFWC